MCDQSRPKLSSRGPADKQAYYPGHRSDYRGDPIMDVLLDWEVSEGHPAYTQICGLMDKHAFVISFSFRFDIPPKTSLLRDDQSAIDANGRQNSFMLLASKLFVFLVQISASE